MRYDLFWEDGRLVDSVCSAKLDGMLTLTKAEAKSDAEIVNWHSYRELYWLPLLQLHEAATDKLVSTTFVHGLDNQTDGCDSVIGANGCASMSHMNLWEVRQAHSL